MTKTPFVHYFRCDCGRLRMGESGQTIICLTCMIDHELSVDGRRAIRFGRECVRTAALMREMP